MVDWRFVMVRFTLFGSCLLIAVQSETQMRDYCMHLDAQNDDGGCALQLVENLPFLATAHNGSISANLNCCLRFVSLSLQDKWRETVSENNTVLTFGQSFEA